VIQIKSRFTGDVLKEVDAANLRGADLRDANLRGADLRGANLCAADLRGADLCGADLRDANLRGADLCGADLCGADLRDANLRGADLCGADLRAANLRGADLCGEKLKSIPVFIYGLKWFVTVTNEFLTIGCQRHTHAEWAAFSDEQISDMDEGALNFWQMWKPSLLSVCAVQAAVK
jgi:hypothetical protein